ncbi:hypothetical protein H1235_02855 [Pseudoxanthomonas sp. NC8]|nr:hypothetical protein H1235_02855 [Pseudoxanthomonas sp. NC8]
MPTALLVAAIVYGTHIMFGRGSLSLAVAAVALRGLALLLNFVTGVNLNFESVDRIEHVTWFGAEVGYPVGMLNPWALVAQISNVLVIAYLAQTLYRVRRDSPAWWSALLICGGWLLLVFSMLATNLSVVLGLPRLPLGTLPGSVIMVLLLSVLLVRELRRGRRMDALMQESELRHVRARRELELAADDANLGLWQWDVATGTFTQNETNYALLGHAGNNGAATRVLFGNAELGEEEERAFLDATRQQAYEFEYRIQRPDGERRWILLRGGVEHGPLGDPLLVRGVTWT